MCPNHSLYVQRPYARSTVSFPATFCVFVLRFVLLYIVRVSPNERTRHFVKYMKMALQAYLVYCSARATQYSFLKKTSQWPRRASLQRCHFYHTIYMLCTPQKTRELGQKFFTLRRCQGVLTQNIHLLEILNIQSLLQIQFPVQVGLVKAMHLLITRRLVKLKNSPIFALLKV